MKNSVFLVSLGLAWAGGMVVLARTYHVQANAQVRPFVVKYEVSSSRSLQDQPKVVLHTITAVRSDGTFMTTNSASDASGQIVGPKAVQLADRYLVVDPLTKSVSTYQPYKKLIVATRDCGGVPDGTILGHAVERVAHDFNSTAQGMLSVQEWDALDLNCAPLREHSTLTLSDGSKGYSFKEAKEVIVGQPPSAYFSVPANYQERGPAAVDDEFGKKAEGRHIFQDRTTLNKMDKKYQADQARIAAGADSSK